MLQCSKRCVAREALTAISAMLIIGMFQPARGAMLCVNPGGSSGCQSTISAAVKAATAGDTIQVAAGTYKEEVTVNQPLSIIGAGSATTIIDATGLSNGVFIDGSASAPKSGVANVLVSGFTIENANFTGILIENASYVTISNNQVVNNDKSLNLAMKPACAGLPAALKSGEGGDCGEGMQLSGVDHSVISNNVIQNNSGGILVSDDTGPTFNNVITGNLVTQNPFDCGITLASHAGNGVYHNTVSSNQSIANGLGAGGGAGIGMFASGPNDKTYANVVLGNTITGNGHPGVSIHNHASPPGAKPVDLDDNVIIGNTISGNGADTGDAATPGPTGINISSVAPLNGTVIAENVILQETVGLGFKAPGLVAAHLNNFMGINTGVRNPGAGSVDATQNWWGCSGGAGVLGCSVVTGNVMTSASLATPFNITMLPPAIGSTTPPGTGTTGVTIVVSGPGGATSTTNTFQTLSNLVTLDASKSTSANAGTLMYSWAVSAGFPSVSITGANTATPTIQLNSKGTYQFTLTVTDSTGASSMTNVTIQYI